MNTSSPFLFPFKFPASAQEIPAWLQPPAWLVQEVQQKLVLALNHVLQQESEACARLARQSGRVVSVQSAPFSLALIATPAGLLDIAPADAKPDLSIAVIDTNPFAVMQSIARGEKPALRIEGDVQFAAEVNWLVDHVRWDMEEDLSRVVGRTSAYSIQACASSSGWAEKICQLSA